MTGVYYFMDGIKYTEELAGYREVGHHTYYVLIDS